MRRVVVPEQIYVFGATTHTRRNLSQSHFFQFVFECGELFLAHNQVGHVAFTPTFELFVG
jgi:hypothetical protein